MQPNDDRKNPILFPPLILVRGAEDPHKWYERELQAWAVRGRIGGNGPLATDAIAYTARGKRWPGRLTDRLITDGLEAGCLIEWADEYPQITAEFVTRLKRKLGYRDDRVA